MDLRHTYRELLPAAARQPYVECYWYATSSGSPPFERSSCWCRICPKPTHAGRLARGHGWSLATRKRNPAEQELKRSAQQHFG